MGPVCKKSVTMDPPNIAIEPATTDGEKATAKCVTSLFPRGFIFGCGSKIGTEHGAHFKRNQGHSNLRSNSWWFHFDPQPFTAPNVWLLWGFEENSSAWDVIRGRHPEGAAVEPKKNGGWGGVGWGGGWGVGTAHQKQATWRGLSSPVAVGKLEASLLSGSTVSKTKTDH